MLYAISLASNIPKRSQREDYISETEIIIYNLLIQHKMKLFGSLVLWLY